MSQKNDKLEQDEFLKTTLFKGLKLHFNILNSEMNFSGNQKKKKKSIHSLIHVAIISVHL